MKLKTALFLIFYTLLFLFYPGDSELYHTFAYHRNLFAQNKTILKLSTQPFPVLKQIIDPVITAESAYIVDLPTMTPIYEKNARVRMLPASTTKIITALVAYDLYKPDQIISVRRPLEDGQVMELVPGERITVENLLYGTLVQSGNDAAYALAQPVGLNSFVDRMNAKAEELHMLNTHFTNPAGLHNSNQYSSSYDLALAGRAILKNHYLSKIVSTKEIEISDVDYQRFHKLVNINKLLGEIPGIGGLKTGYTIESGENLITLYKRHDGHEILIILLRSLDRFEDTRTIVNWIDSNVEYINQPIQ